MFDVKSKVICINDVFPSDQRLHAYYKKYPVKGKIYTVRDITQAQDYQGESTCAVLLEEIMNPDNDIKGRGEFGFSITRFREPTQLELEESIKAQQPASV